MTGVGMKQGLGRIVAGAMVASIAMPTIAQAACVPTSDQASVAIRALQTELMVAGLKCSADQWNAFTGKFKATIKNDADRLQSLFKKTYGPKGGASQMNMFVTQLANDASQSSNRAAEAQYCREEDKIFAQVMTLTGLELERFAAMRPLKVTAPVALCAPEPEFPIGTPVVATAAPAPTPSAKKHK